MAKTAKKAADEAISSSGDWWIYCTATNGTKFVEWLPGPNGLHQIGKSVEIKGGAGVAARRTFITSYGVRTVVNQEDMEFLNSNKMFQHMVRDGWIKVVKSSGWGVDPDAVAQDMAQRDGSTPIVPADIPEGNAVTTGRPPENMPTTRPRTIPLRQPLQSGFR